MYEGLSNLKGILISHFNTCFLVVNDASLLNSSHANY